MTETASDTSASARSVTSKSVAKSQQSTVETKLEARLSTASDNLSLNHIMSSVVADLTGAMSDHSYSRVKADKVILATTKKPPSTVEEHLQATWLEYMHKFPPPPFSLSSSPFWLPKPPSSPAPPAPVMVDNPVLNDSPTRNGN